MTKKEFLKAYNNHPPGKAQVWFYRYFSQATVPVDKTLVHVLTGFWTSMIFMGIIFTAFQFVVLKLIITFLFGITFFPFCVFALIMISAKHLRLRRVRKELGISRKEYEKLANKYL